MYVYEGKRRVRHKGVTQDRPLLLLLQLASCYSIEAVVPCYDAGYVCALLGSAPLWQKNLCLLQLQLSQYASYNRCMPCMLVPSIYEAVSEGGQQSKLTTFQH